MMEKLKMHSPNKVDENTKKREAVFELIDRADHRIENEVRPDGSRVSIMEWAIDYDIKHRILP